MLVLGRTATAGAGEDARRDEPRAGARFGIEQARVTPQAEQEGDDLSAGAAVSANEERRLSASLRLLVAAGRELASSFDYPRTLAALAQLIVPEFASGFSVEIDEGKRRATRTHVG